ncbi:hypothetical protein L484_015444 [Morus notabilis]|uniref:tRNA synthetases class I catalytic domain-containing protein n=1 Tax=Morus notabilis TaxID=981085 RepID=W9RYB7_9ROSA|nr:hypothetical protein L484_015444 [Morus notabilis]
MAKEEFRIYNSMTQQKEILKPNVPGKVGMYVCGVTAYDLSHIGHARAAVNFDVLYRYLQNIGYEVTYVRNFTDVDDKQYATVENFSEGANCCVMGPLDLHYVSLMLGGGPNAVEVMWQQKVLWKMVRWRLMLEENRLTWKE